MFSTAMGQARRQNFPAYIIMYLEKKIQENHGEPARFLLETLKNPNNVEDDYRITCGVCQHSQTRVICDWSKDYDLDGLVSSVLDFTNKHHHRVEPVMDIAGSFPPALVEYLKGYRKFREV